ncbi:MAG: TetR/AcrR family transcriptional regulator [Caulobacteraceae bacterium]|nr:TetR/AcrR family transcriptional regulator [Caulobacter sp.]
MGEPAEGRTKARCILDAARKCFAKHGFHGASMARIAEEAGISVGHIYRYFENKEAVVAAIVEEDLLGAAEQIAGLGCKPEEIAERTLEHIQEKALGGVTALRLEILSEAARNPRIAAIMHDSDARVRELLRDALLPPCAAGARPEAAEARIELVCALWEGLAMRVFKQQGALDPALLREAKTVLARMLAAPL